MEDLLFFNKIDFDLTHLDYRFLIDSFIFNKKFNMIYCFDLDGTLCNTDENNYEGSTPKKDRIKKVNELYDKGHTILVDTARGSVSGKNYFFFTLNQLKSWGLKFHTLRTGVKIGADVFVDDKGISDLNFFK